MPRTAPGPGMLEERPPIVGVFMHDHGLGRDPLRPALGSKRQEDALLIANGRCHFSARTIGLPTVVFVEGQQREALFAHGHVAADESGRVALAVNPGDSAEYTFVDISRRRIGHEPRDSGDIRRGEAVHEFFKPVGLCNAIAIEKRHDLAARFADAAISTGIRPGMVIIT